ncbi:DUF4029 domain-containing protein [Bacillus sp. Xin]|nr:DUF4029 domain-containing protein [Bacillus sp. Xin]NSW37297.1 DUF4029 domain-containing protein [Bacillus sp. Xin1]
MYSFSLSKLWNIVLQVLCIYIIFYIFELLLRKPKKFQEKEK